MFCFPSLYFHSFSRATPLVDRSTKPSLSSLSTDIGMCVYVHTDVLYCNLCFPIGIRILCMTTLYIRTCVSTYMLSKNM